MFDTKKIIEKAEKRAERKKRVFEKITPFGFVAMASGAMGFLFTGSPYFLLAINLIAFSILFLFFTAKMDVWYANKVKRKFEDS